LTINMVHINTCKHGQAALAAKTRTSIAAPPARHGHPPTTFSLFSATPGLRPVTGRTWTRGAGLRHAWGGRPLCRSACLPWAGCRLFISYRCSLYHLWHASALSPITSARNILSASPPWTAGDLLGRFLRALRTRRSCRHAPHLTHLGENRRTVGWHPYLRASGLLPFLPRVCLPARHLTCTLPCDAHMEQVVCSWWRCPSFSVVNDGWRIARQPLLPLRCHFRAPVCLWQCCSYGYVSVTPSSIFFGRNIMFWYGGSGTYLTGYAACWLRPNALRAWRGGRTCW